MSSQGWKMKLQNLENSLISHRQNLALNQALNTEDPNHICEHKSHVHS